MTNIAKALRVATAAHRGQLRKETNEPYIVHPMAVAGLVAGVAGIDLYTNLGTDLGTDMVVAAILHDTVEDTDLTILDIANKFGTNVAWLVDELTDVAVPSDGNRAIRIEINRQHTAKASPEAKTIKLADLIDNTKTICLYSKPNFARIYLAEKILLLEVLKEGNQELYKIAVNLTKRMEKIV